MMRYKLYKEQQLNCRIEVPWEFFSSPMNLVKITPKETGFIVLSDFKEEEIGKGMVIEYQISPILNIPIKWVTEITQVDKNKSFTDYQKEGPYKYWNHLREFIPNEKGGLMVDKVHYEMPFGFLGTFLSRVW